MEINSVRTEPTHMKRGNTYEQTRKAPKHLTVTIEKLVYGGMGLGKHQGKVIFVPFSVPGDRLRVRPVEEKKTFIRAEIAQILKPGDGRVAPVCPHFGKCGGCHLQQLEYLRQVEAKRQILEETMHHRFPETRELPIIMSACTQPLGYRSRARVQMRGAGEKASVGFYRHRSHVVEDIETCPLLRPSLNEALSSLRQFKLKVDLDANPQEMDMACSHEEGTWATARVGAEPGDGGIPLLGTRRAEDVILRRKVGGFHYSVTASVFFQANDFMVLELAALVQELSANKGRDAALDLFSGVGLVFTAAGPPVRKNRCSGEFAGGVPFMRRECFGSRTSQHSDRLHRRRCLDGIRRILRIKQI